LCGSNEQCSSRSCESGRCCAAADDNCVSCNFGGRCNSCNPDYFLSPNDFTCQVKVAAGAACTLDLACPSGACRNNRCCAQDIPSCSKCDENGVCSSCEGGFELTSDGLSCHERQLSPFQENAVAFGLVGGLTGVAGLGAMVFTVYRRVKYSKRLPSGFQYHFFLSHKQSSGGLQASLLCEWLQRARFKVWFDLKRDDEINLLEMYRVVAQSAV